MSGDFRRGFREAMPTAQELGKILGTLGVIWGIVAGLFLVIAAIAILIVVVLSLLRGA